MQILTSENMDPANVAFSAPMINQLLNYYFMISLLIHCLSFTYVALILFYVCRRTTLALLSHKQVVNNHPSVLLNYSLSCHFPSVSVRYFCSFIS